MYAKCKHSFVLGHLEKDADTADLLNAFYQANHAGLLAGQLGAAYFIPTFLVPLLLLTHGLIFRILLQHHGESATRESLR